MAAIESFCKEKKGGISVFWKGLNEEDYEFQIELLNRLMVLKVRR